MLPGVQAPTLGFRESPIPVRLATPYPQVLHALAGLRIPTAMAGVRDANSCDVVLCASDEDSAVAGVFTTNRNRAAPGEP